MSTLHEGITIIDTCDNILLEKPRVLISAGTQKPVNNKYCSDAYIPANPWREPNLDERNMLYLKREFRTDNCIGIFKVPDKLISPLEILGVQNISSIEEYRQVVNSEKCGAVLKDMESYFADSMNVKTTEIKMLGVNFSPAGKETVTYDPQEKCYIGLHLDSWDKLPLRQRFLSRNRLCINLGKEDRYLLFINLPLIAMYNMLPSNTNNWEKFYSGSKVGYEFMRLYPDYPIIKLRLRPKEAYIAPTENMIHDGCTLDRLSPDLTLTFFGHFGFW